MALSAGMPLTLRKSPVSPVLSLAKPPLPEEAATAYALGVAEWFDRINR